MTHRTCLLLILGALSSLPLLCRAEAGPPMVTDDPGAPEKGHFEINTAFTYEDRPHEKEFETPLINLLGAFGTTFHSPNSIPYRARIYSYLAQL